MIGVVLVTHNTLADAFISIVEHIMGKQEQMVAVSINPGDDMELRRQDIMQATAHVDSGNGVIILTDMFGGTPSNLAISVMNSDMIEVLAGMNLPMLIKLVSVRAMLPLSETAAQAQEAGRKYINIARNLLNNNEKDGNA